MTKIHFNFNYEALPVDGELILNNDDKNDQKELSMLVDHENIKHLFYMLHGQLDTKTRTFSGDIEIEKQNIIELAETIVRILNAYHVDTYTTQVNIGFKNNSRTLSLEQFRSEGWNIPNKTIEISLKISFLYDDRDINGSVNHSIYIRFSEGLKPGNLLQLLASSDSEKLDNLEEFMSPIFCRTDSVRDEISQHLMSAVEAWHDSQGKIDTLSNSYKFFAKHKYKVAVSVHYIPPIAMTFLLCYATFSTIELFSPKYVPAAIGSIIIASGIFLIFSDKIGKSRADKIYRKLNTAEGKSISFNITKGDEKAHKEIINRNNKLFSDSKNIMIWTVVKTLTLSLIAGGLIEVIKYYVMMK